MLWSLTIVYLTIVTIAIGMNRPVYKIVLTQKGYTQFLQYDVETPPLREFTFCAWIRFYDLKNDQSIFTYVAEGNNKILRLWLDSGGHHMMISINGVAISSTPIDMTKDVWRHICLSYQSDYGAWALYVDSRLLSCEAAHSLNGYVLPAGGSVIIGYGTADDGSTSGLAGEVFGVNMLLSSTIERNYTMKKNPVYQQKYFRKNTIRGNKNNINKYVVLSGLQTDEIRNNVENTTLPPFLNINRIYTPNIFVESKENMEVVNKKRFQIDPIANEKEIPDFSNSEKVSSTTDKMNFWNFVNTADNFGKFKYNTNREQSKSGSKDRPIISQYEKPPSPNTHLQNHFGIEKLPVSESFYKMSEDSSEPNKKIFGKYSSTLSVVETPPPPGKSTKVYGQWTSYKSPGNVLNYLKSINFHHREQKKTPSTIPLTKISDNYPYASDFKVNKVRLPIQYKRRNFIEQRLVQKREINSKQINVQILENDLRNDILKSHAKTQPQNVEVTSRGEAKKKVDGRYYRHTSIEESLEHSDNDNKIFKPKPFAAASNIRNKKILSNFDLHKSNKLLSILPFLKSVEYFLEDPYVAGSEKLVNSNDMYIKSLANANKWHNVKSYSNDYTPRRINMKLDNSQSDIEEKIAEANKRHPSIRLKYKHEKKDKNIIRREDDNITKGRALAIEVSNQSNDNKEAISLLKYNHGYLPEHERKIKQTINKSASSKGNSKQNTIHVTTFNKSIKIGNVLNERQVLGNNEQQKKKSFVGGNEKVPDINRYRSDLDLESSKVPPSLGPAVCRNVELYDRVLYVQQDGSIDMTHILSPLRMKNVGIEFILQNYKKCSLEESALEKNIMLFIDWNKTPVRLFGGASPKKTTDLCGFFF